MALHPIQHFLFTFLLSCLYYYLVAISPTLQAKKDEETLQAAIAAGMAPHQSSASNRRSAAYKQRDHGLQELGNKFKGGTLSVAHKEMKKFIDKGGKGGFSKGKQGGKGKGGKSSNRVFKGVMGMLK